MAPTLLSDEVSNYYIPDEIAFRILSKLPVKSLKRFGCVHKSWSNLFENPQFMSTYRKDYLFKDDDNTQNSRLLLKHSHALPDYNDTETLYLLTGETFENSVKLDWPPPFQFHRDIFIAGNVVNGILCLYQGNVDYHSLELKFLLWNPATGEFKVIPPGSFVSPAFKAIPPDGPPSIIIETCIHLHGFGYDPMTDDYKLIRHVRYPDGVEEDDSHVSDLWEIYSLRSNCWRKLSVEMPNQWWHWKLQRIDFAVYLNGVCHWVGYEDFNAEEDLLVSFNLSDEDFIITYMNHRDRSHGRCLMELKGSIAVITEYGDTNCFEISILGELGVAESWTKVFSIGPIPSVYFIPIGVGKKGNIFVTTNLAELAWLDVNTEMIEEIGLQGNDERCQIVVYNESLLPIGGINR